MRKLSYIVPVIVACLCSCGGDEVEVPAVEVRTVSVDKAGCEVVMGETVQLRATVLPEDAEDVSVVWMSTDESVAAVDQTGLVTGVAKGTATIRAVALMNGKMGICAVQVLSDGSDADQSTSGGATIEDFK